MLLERLPTMAAIAEKLGDLGGTGPLKAREWRIRCRFGRHDKAATAVRHLIYGERMPTIEEVKQIEAAHLKFCAEKVRQNALETDALFREMHAALAAMEESDPEFYRPHIEAVRELLFPHRDSPGEDSDEA